MKDLPALIIAIGTFFASATATILTILNWRRQNRTDATANSASDAAKGAQAQVKLNKATLDRHATRLQSLTASVKKIPKNAKDHF